MKKLVFASLVGSMAMPVLVSAQDAEPVTATPISVEETDRSEEEEEEAEAPTEEATPESSWTDNLSYNIFADAFYMVDWNRPDVATAATNVPHRGYEYTDGFGLAFAGVDASYTSEHWGATVSLRYGVGAQRYLIGGALTASDPLDPTTDTSTPAFAVPALSALKQAYGSIMPTENLVIDVGLFDTIYGAEVADSWVNINYSRSALNYLMQPFYHLGVRASYQVTDSIVVKGLVANSTNAYTGFSGGAPYLGGQVGYTSDIFSAYVGYMTGQPGTRTSRSGGEWEHFIDVVGTLSLGDFTLVGNFDLWKSPSSDAGWGVSVTGGYQINEMFGVGARLDYLNPSATYFATPYDKLVTATATLDFRPYGDHVILRLEQRFEHATEDVFVDNNGMRDTWMSTVLSAVVRTGN